MSNLPVLPSNAQLPVLNIPAELLAQIDNQFAQAAANATTGIPRLSFGGKMFNLSFGGGEPIELQDRVLDVHIVAIDPQFHYTFYEKSYTGTDSDKDGRVLSRYPLPTDPIEFIPTQEWSQRAYKQRVILMLANDPEHKLYVADFGYNSVKKVGNPQLGLLNLGQLSKMLNMLSTQPPHIKPFMVTVQLSFTKASVSEVQFSFINQLTQGNNEMRYASQSAINAVVQAYANGEVAELLKIEYDSSTNQHQGESVTQAPQAPVAQAPGLATL